MTSGTPAIDQRFKSMHGAGTECRCHRALRRLLREQFIGIAIPPILPRLERANYRMLRRVVVLGGVLVLGRIAAADMSAGETQTQMHPCVAHLEALLAAF